MILKEIKHINYIVFPLIISRFCSFLFIFIDQWLGTIISQDGYIAISVAGQVSYIVIGTFGAIAIPLNILGSSYLQQGKTREYETLFNTSFFLTNIIGLSLVFIFFIFSEHIFKIFFKIEPEILRLTVIYFKVITIEIWITMCLFIYSSFFKVQEKTKIIMVGVFINNVVNISISATLVLGLFGFPKLGVLGAGIGTVTGGGVNLLLYYLYFKRKAFFKLKNSFNYEVSIKILKKYIPILTQDFIEDGLLTLILTYILAYINPYLLGEFNLLGTISNFLLIGTYSYAIISTNLIIKNSTFIYKKLIPLLSSLSMTVVFLIFTSILLLSKNYIFKLYTTQTWVIDSIFPVFFINTIFIFPNIFLEIYKYALNGLNRETFIIKTLFIQKSLILLTIYLFKPQNLKTLIIIVGCFQLTLALTYIFAYYRNISLHSVE